MKPPAATLSSACLRDRSVAVGRRSVKRQRDIHLLLATIFVCAATAVSAAPPDVAITLAREGKPTATIVVGLQATRAAQFAACELQWHLREITGGEFAIVTDDQPREGLVILVGDSRPLRALGIDPDALRPQEYLIRFTPRALVLVGRDKDDRGIVKYDQTPSQHDLETWPSVWDEQGTMYATYDFLERYCGVRWFNATQFGTDIPHQPTLTVVGSQLQREPFMKYRFAAYPNSENYDLYTGLWPAGSEGQQRWETAAYPTLHARFSEDRYMFAKRGWNTLFRLRHREGGEKCPGNHSLYGYYRRFWEPEPGQESQFEAQHSDWFAQGYSGRPPQMCYTSRGLIEQVARDACEFFETGKDYQGSQADGNFFCVEPMDNDQFCKCPHCQAWLGSRDAGTPFFTNGRHSDYFFQFVNEVARIVGQKHPDKRIVCLAYMTHGAPPKKLRLEPNVIVQYCFACNRLNYDLASYHHEVELLKQWRQEYPDRTLYLWLYYTFPVEIALNGNFHCFPGFFAHSIGRQFELFRQQDFRGVFHCGYGQDVEAYVTYRLMDDPTLPVDTLLDEYFTRLYGAAAKPMRSFYDVIEQTYGDPANYPEAIAEGRWEGHHHQTQEMAWGYLGNTHRMKVLGGLMQQAKAAAQTHVELQRVALFESGIWDYLLAGRAQYMQQVRARWGDNSAALRVPCAVSQPLHGDPATLKPAEALNLSRWWSPLAEPTRRKLTARLIQDGKNLTIQLEELGDPQHLVLTDSIVEGDYWQVLLADPAGGTVHSLLLNAAGQQRWDGGTTSFPVSAQRSAQASCVSVTIPLAQVGIATDQGVRMNLVRRSGRSDEPLMWSPSFGAVEDPHALRQLLFDSSKTIPAEMPSTADLARLEKLDRVAHWSLQEGQAAQVHSDSPELVGRLVNGAAWQQDASRSVVRLHDSRQQYIDFGDHEAFNLTGPLTFATWVKYAPTDVWYPALLGKGYEQTGTYGMHIRPDGTAWFELDAPDGTRHIYNPTDLLLTVGQWCHVVATYDGTVMRIYLNGREAGAGKEVATTVRTNSEPLRFGWLGSYGHFNGCVRDVRLYRRAMSRSEVFARYLAEREEN